MTYPISRQSGRNSEDIKHNFLMFSDSLGEHDKGAGCGIFRKIGDSSDQESPMRAHREQFMSWCCQVCKTD